MRSRPSITAARTWGFAAVATLGGAIAVAGFLSRPAVADSTPPLATSESPPPADSETQVQAAEPSPEVIARWITELDSDRFQVREDATDRLITAGEAAVAPLTEAALGRSPEVTSRAVRILLRMADSYEEPGGISAYRGLVMLSGARHRAASPRAHQAQQRVLSAWQEVATRRVRELGGKVTLDEYSGRVSVELAHSWRGGDAGLDHLQWLGNIYNCVLNGPHFTQTAIPHLARLRQLEALRLFGTSITADGERLLGQLLTETVIDRRDGALLGVAGLPHESGCLIQEVRQNSAAEKAGLLVGDVITAFDGKPVKDFEGLTALIARKKPGEMVTVEVHRNVELLQRDVVLGEWRLDDMQ